MIRTPMIFAIVVYTLAMAGANLSVAVFGPSVTPINAFLLIGLDLTLRDWLHVRLRVWHMGALIAFTGALSYALNPSTGHIAIASAIAFTFAALVDWGMFVRIKGPWLLRANGSNMAAAAVDSIIFPTIAFGALMPQVVLAQFVAKSLGGAMWAWFLSRFLQDYSSQSRA